MDYIMWKWIPTKYEIYWHRHIEMKHRIDTKENIFVYLNYNLGSRIKVGRFWNGLRAETLNYCRNPYSPSRVSFVYSCDRCTFILVCNVLVHTKCWQKGVLYENDYAKYELCRKQIWMMIQWNIWIHESIMVCYGIWFAAFKYDGNW